MTTRPAGGWPAGTPSQAWSRDEGDYPPSEYMEAARALKPNNIHDRDLPALAEAIQTAVETFEPEEE